MGRRKRFKIQKKQRVRRRKRLKKLREKKADVKEYFLDGRYIGPRAAK